jgi:thymidylate synthase (FAD)
MIAIIEPYYYWPETTEAAFPRMVEHLERCGRICYKSEDLITEDSANKFVERICRNRHESVLEHCTATAIVVCSRACSHQLVRHRIAAYSQESQRYCDYGKKSSLQVICPPSIGIEPGDYTAEHFENTGCLVWKNGKQWIGSDKPVQWLWQVDGAYSEYLAEIKEGVPPGDARFVLPNACKTELAVTFNLRQWRHFFRTRCDSHAQWEIRGIATAILTDFTERMPSVFEDIYKEMVCSR